MLLVLGLATGLLVGSPAGLRGGTSRIAMSAIYDLTAEKIDGSSMPVADKGAPMLMVNVASR